MQITKSNGTKQQFNPQKVWKRIKDQCKDLKGVSPDKLFQKVIPSISDGMTSTQIDEILAHKAADLIIDHPDYSLLGGRLLITRQSKITGIEVEEVDLTYGFFGAVTFLKKYSLRDEKGQPKELPSTMYKRVAKYLSNTDSEYKEFYAEFSSKKSTVATPILTNAGSGGDRNGFLSCNLSHLVADSTEGILETLDSISNASREGAGIGLCIDNLRSKESLVSSFKGKAGGVTRFADMVQSHMRFFRQGSRSGSCALYLSVWHKDIFDFLELRLPVGDEKLRARDLFTAVTIPDNFMKALVESKPFYLFCPDDIKKSGLKPLYELWGEEYEQEYNKAVELGIGEEVNPKKIWDAIIRSQVESGTPYVFFKDNANKVNMQDNIGVIRQSQLCIEVVQVTRPNYTAQCTLGSINLSEHDNFDTIAKSAKTLVKILNNVIDKTSFPDEAAKTAGLEQRAIAIGVAGLADFFAKKKVAYHSESAKILNKEIFKCIYNAAQQESQRLGEKYGSYSAWEGSRYSKGETLTRKVDKPVPMRNSLLIGLMPTASTSILLGVNESMEAFESNMFVRNTGSGEFTVINQHLVKDLEEIGLWNDSIIKKIIQNKGSVQEINDIPPEIRETYKTIWEIPMRHVIDMAADRQVFVDQAQSMNLYFATADYTKISGALKYGWERGLKTGVYYTKTLSKIEAPKRLYQSQAEELPQKPENSPFECFGCTT